MKKTLSMIIGVLVGAAAFAEDGLSQLTVTMSTEGPDYYADNKPVLVGETYLLVYVAQGAGFKGVYADGTLVDPVSNKVVTSGLAIEGAKCGFKAIQYPSDMYPSGGSFVIVVLDTRTDAGAVGGLVAGYGEAAAGGAPSSATPSPGRLSVAAEDGNGAPALAAAAAALAPADTPAPVIKSVAPNGQTVQVRIGNFTGKAVYEVQSRPDLATGQWQPATGAARVQASALDLEQEELPAAVQVPENDRVRFFRVIVKGSN